jgi:hypothetical protein
MNHPLGFKSTQSAVVEVAITHIPRLFSGVDQAEGGCPTAGGYQL